MRRSLVLLTKNYPFGRGEEFIENEMPVLSREFGRVLVLATQTEDGPRPTRALPENARAFSVPASRIRRRIPAAAAKYFLSEGCGDVREREAVGRSMKRKLYEAYFLAKSDAIARECTALLEGCGFDGSDGTVFYSYWFHDTALAALKLREKFGAGLGCAVSRAHRYDLYAEKNPAGFLPMRYFLLENLDRVFPCSEDGASYLKSRYPAYADKIETSYLGTEDFGAGPAGSDGVFRIVSCCHLSPVKRVDLLARSLALLEGSGRKLAWTHFGGGDGLDDLKEYAAGHLSFMECSFPGEVKNQELMEYYRKNPVDCFVNTSSSEGLPVSIMEACSFGIPAVATDVGGTAEIVRDGRTGFLLGADFTPEELAGKLSALGDMPRGERENLRAECRALWREKFCAERNYERFAREIAELV